MYNKSLIFKSFGSPVEQLTLDSCRLPSLRAGQLRVAMSLAPINPSDLIPITGAYVHRISLPGIAGYEGVGTVIETPATHSSLLGRRVLPLRGPGTWQSYVDCDPDLAITVPDQINDDVAARAYINPLAASTMLDRFPVSGKTILLSGAGSSCAEMLARWAQQQGARKVMGIYRSGIRAGRLLANGVEPISQDDALAVERAAREADITFDALGGNVGSTVLASMRATTVFVGYGLLSGQGLKNSGQVRASYHRFHLRDTLACMTSTEWQSRFAALWPMLANFDLPSPEIFSISDWRSAINKASTPGSNKCMLRFN